MLSGRLYRAAFVPLLLVLVVAGFSISDRPPPITSPLAPDAFDGADAYRTLTALASGFPNRRPGSTADDAIATFVQRAFSHPAGPLQGTFTVGAAQPFVVSQRSIDAQTIDGKQSLTTVTAERAGQSSHRIVIIAHRDAAARSSEAELSATAALIELARVFANRETQRTLTLVSTSGGSGGDAGAADYAAHVGGPVDAVIVLGDLAGARASKPFVVPWSNALGSAPPQLQRTLEDAINQEVGVPPGGVSVLDQFAHLALPFTTTEQGVLGAHGLPAVLVQVSGERGPQPYTPVSQDRLQNFGRAVLRAVYALDGGPDIPSAPSAVILAQRKVIPAWAVRLLVAALMLPALLTTLDGLARVRRRRESIGRWLGWTLACAIPWALCALFVIVLGRSGAIPAPGAPVAPWALPVSATARNALVAATLVLVLAWTGWALLIRRVGLGGAPASAAAGISLLLVIDALALLVWIANPYTAILLVPALHLLMPVADPALRPRRWAALALALAGLLPLAGVVAIYAHQLGMGPIEVAWTALLLVAGGHVGPLAALLWSVALGCMVAAAMIALRGRRLPEELPAVTVRGPSSYAGPGSLGGTESALRR